MKALILNGPAESGKGTFVEILEELYSISTYSRSSIDYIKEVAQVHFYWDGNKDIKSRNFLADLKRISINYCDAPFKDIVRHLSWAKHEDLYIIDVREPKEIAKLVEYFNKEGIPCMTIRIVNTKKEEVAAKSLSKHGDNEYADYEYDLCIPNDGTIEEFKQLISCFGRRILQGV